MSRSSWGLVMAVAFNIVLAVTPIPERWRVILAVAAWVVFILACVGWLTTHSERIRRWRGSPRATKPMTLLIIGVVGGLLTVSAWLLVPKQLDSDRTPPKPQPDTSETNHTAQRLDEIANALKGLGEQATREKLLKKFPLGYVVFDVDYKNSVFPYDQVLLDQYDLDWKVVSLKADANRFELRLPDISLKDGRGGLEKIVVKGDKVASIYAQGVIVGDLSMLTQVLAVRDTGMVFVVGFAPANLPVRMQLTEFWNEGSQILEELMATRTLEPSQTRANKWAEKVENYLNEKGMKLYVLRFQNATSETYPPGGASQRTRPLANWLYTRIRRLEEFVKELGRQS